jgi:cytochrome P450
MHFGLGGRQCVGKTIALTNIYKLASTLLKEFDFELVASGKDTTGSGDTAKKRAGGHMPELVSVSVSDLKHPLMVRVKGRTAV